MTIQPPDPIKITVPVVVDSPLDVARVGVQAPGIVLRFDYKDAVEQALRPVSKKDGR